MAHTVPVLPIVDSLLGTVTIRHAGRWVRFIAPHPGELDRALRNAARRPDFEPESGALMVRVPGAGRADGNPLVFFLERLPEPAPAREPVAAS